MSLKPKIKSLFWAITAEDYIADSPAVLKKDHVNRVPYNAEWTAMAQIKASATLPR